MKAEKCYWTIQNYCWKARKCRLLNEKEFNITIKKGGARMNITCVLPQQHRNLVGIEVNPAHVTKSIVPTFQEKIDQHKARLQTCRLVPILILQDC